MAALALVVVGAVVAQDPANPQNKGAGAGAGGNAAKDKDKAKVPAGRKGLLKAPARTPAKRVPKGADPLANAGNINGAVVGPNQPFPQAGTFHYRFKVSVGDAEPISVAYYPSKLGRTAAVAILVHERERSGKDFEESIAELKKLSLAEELQKQDYAVAAVDLRGHGGSTPRRTVGRSEWPSVASDIQTTYYFLVDRHNRGELNLAKLGVVAMGEGANLAANWAAQGGGVSTEGRVGDIGALVLISPMIDAQALNVTFKPAVTAIAARIPLDVLVGERDPASSPLVDDGPASLKTLIKRFPANKVETFPSALHGYKLLHFEPGFAPPLIKFLDTTVKNKADTWEGRYLFNVVNYADIKVIKNPIRVAPPAPAEKKAN